jgi:hypothetical protein
MIGPQYGQTLYTTNTLINFSNLTHSSVNGDSSIAINQLVGSVLHENTTACM